MCAGDKRHKSDPKSLICLGGIEFTVVRVEGDPSGQGLPTRLLLERDGVTGEYLLSVATDANHNPVQTGPGARRTP